MWTKIIMALLCGMLLGINSYAQDLRPENNPKTDDFQNQPIPPALQMDQLLGQGSPPQAQPVPQVQPAPQVQPPPQIQLPPQVGQQNMPLPSGLAIPNNAPSKGQSPPPTQIPPGIIIQGKEKESFQKVFVDKVKIGQPIELKLLMFDREPTEVLVSTTYGLPESAKYEFKVDEKQRNRATANLTWTPTGKDKGFHTIIVELSNSKGTKNRMSFSYDVEK